MKIGSYEVEVINRDTVKVGCQVVARVEIEQILKEMNSPPLKFVVPRPGYAPSFWSEHGYLCFRLQTREGGWFAAENSQRGFDSKWADFCLTRHHATQLRDFLNAALGEKPVEEP